MRLISFVNFDFSNGSVGYISVEKVCRFEAAGVADALLQPPLAFLHIKNRLVVQLKKEPKDDESVVTKEVLALKVRGGVGANLLEHEVARLNFHLQMQFLARSAVVEIAYAKSLRDCFDFGGG